MAYLIEEKELVTFLSRAVEIGFKKGLMTGMVSETKLKPYISKTLAYRIYGRSNVDFWIKKRLVKEIKDGDNNSTIRIDRIQLETIAATSNRGL